MKTQDLHIIISPQKKGKGYYPITFQSLENKRKIGKLFIQDSPMSADSLGSSLYKALTENGYWEIIQRMVDKKVDPFPNYSFMLEIKAKNLVPYVWEDIFDSKELSALINHYVVIRFKSTRTLKSPPKLQLPVDVLLN